MMAVVAVAATVLPLVVFAQAQAPITATPLLPPSTQYPQIQQQPLPPPQQQQTQQQPQQQQQAQPAPQAAPQPVRGIWLPQGNAVLQVLDKVNAQNAVLTVKVGDKTQYGSLAIAVQACDVRPPDQPQDAAAFLVITDSHPDAPGFHGWMLADEPALSMLQHPIYDVRVIGCKT
jgi:hypothetical protein